MVLKIRWCYQGQSRFFEVQNPKLLDGGAAHDVVHVAMRAIVVG